MKEKERGLNEMWFSMKGKRYVYVSLIERMVGYVQIGE